MKIQSFQSFAHEAAFIGIWYCTDIEQWVFTKCMKNDSADECTHALPALWPSKHTNNVVKGKHNNELTVLWECHNECESDYAAGFEQSIWLWIATNSQVIDCIHFYLSIMQGEINYEYISMFHK